MRFFKNSCKGGRGWEVFTRSEGEARNGGGGGGFTMVGWEIVKVSLHN